MLGVHQRFQPTVKSVFFFAKAKKLPLFTAAEAVVMPLNTPVKIERNS